MVDHSMILQADLARRLGVSPQAVRKAIRSGRLRVYDGHGQPVPPNFAGRKWLKPDMAAEDWHNRRQRFDAHAVAASPDPAASDDLLAARARVVSAQAELLEMRIAREQGELISKAAVFESIADVGRAVQRLFKNGVEWSEELYGAAQAGCGLGAFASMLRVRLIELNNSLSDMILAEAARYGDGGDDEGATNV
jgi:hypothetical protein